MAFTKQSEAFLFKSADGRHYYLTGVVSDSDIDRDGDRMSPELLRRWEGQLNNERLTLYQDHQHTIDSGVGVWVKGDINEFGQLIGTAKLEDPEVNSKVKTLLHKLDTGERIGLSIGGDMKHSVKEYDGKTGQKVRTIKDAQLYEISVVGIPANQSSFVTSYEYKSAKPRLFGVRQDEFGPVPDPAAVLKALRYGALMQATDEEFQSDYRQLLTLVKDARETLAKDFNPYRYESHNTGDCSRVHPGLTHKDYDGRFSKDGSEQPTNQITININKTGQFGQILSNRNFAQPEGKIAAEPGKSGSSEVFRTDTGRTPSIGPQDSPFDPSSPSVSAKPTDAKLEEEDQNGYELGSKLDEDGHMYLSDGSHSKRCEEWDALNNSRKEEEDAFAGRPGGAMGHKSLQKHGFQQEIAQQEARRGAVSDEDRKISILERHRANQERLHDLGAPHDATVCRHCTGPAPSRLR